MNAMIISSQHGGLQPGLPIGHELVCDLFAGGGGASEGLERAFGHPVHVAINHNPVAIAVHRVNHPETRHYISDVYEVCPREATAGLPVGHLHASPDCTHHSQAKGGQPRSAKSRALTWVVKKWAGVARPRCITIENVPQQMDWGRLVAKRCPKTGRVVRLDGTVAAKGERVPVREQFLVPCPKHSGRTWKRFVRELNGLGYQVETRVLSAKDYGVPTSRTRLYAVARRDGRPIVWPSPTHGDPASLPVRAGRLKPWRMAAECLDFSKPCHSIFLSKEAAKGLRVKRPLVDATLARLAAGIKRFVLEAELPYLHDGTAGLDAAHIVKFRGTSLGHAASEPLPTVTSGAGANRPAGAAHALGVVQTRLTPATRVVHHMEQANTGLIGHDLREPMSTVTTTGSQQRLVATSLASREEASSDAASAVYRLLCDHLNARDLALIEPYLRHGPRVRGQRTGEVAIQLHGEEMVLTDVGLRMLTPRELARAMGFEDDYVLDVDADGLPVPQHRQVALIGNSVCSAVLEAIVRSNSTDLIHQYQRSGQYIGRDHEDLQHTNSISKEVIQLTTAA